MSAYASRIERDSALAVRRRPGAPSGVPGVSPYPWHRTSVPGVLPVPARAADFADGPVVLASAVPEIDYGLEHRWRGLLAREAAAWLDEFLWACRGLQDVPAAADELTESFLRLAQRGVPATEIDEFAGCTTPVMATALDAEPRFLARAARFDFLAEARERAAELAESGALGAAAPVQAPGAFHHAEGWHAKHGERPRHLYGNVFESDHGAHRDDPAVHHRWEWVAPEYVIVQESVGQPTELHAPLGPAFAASRARTGDRLTVQLRLGRSLVVCRLGRAEHQRVAVYFSMGDFEDPRRELCATVEAKELWLSDLGHPGVRQRLRMGASQWADPGEFWAVARDEQHSTRVRAMLGMDRARLVMRCAWADETGAERVLEVQRGRGEPELAAAAAFAALSSDIDRGCDAGWGGAHPLPE